MAWCTAKGLARSNLFNAASTSRKAGTNIKIEGAFHQDHTKMNHTNLAQSGNRKPKDYCLLWHDRNTSGVHHPLGLFFPRSLHGFAIKLSQDRFGGFAIEKRNTKMQPLFVTEITLAASLYDYELAFHSEACLRIHQTQTSMHCSVKELHHNDLMASGTN